MGIETTHKAITENVSIPTIPEIVIKIGELAQDPMSGTREMGTLVAQDAPLTSKVLRIANSAFYGLRQRVLSTEHAAAVLGSRVLRNIVLQASVIDQYEHLMNLEDFDLGLLWRHSILTGQVSRSIARRATVGASLDADELYTCGLLHDLGKVVLLDSLTDAYVDALRQWKASGEDLCTIEEEVLGFNHTEVGAMVAVRWGLPEGVVHSIQGHHDPQLAVARETSVAIVALANALAEAVAEGRHLDYPEESGQVLGLPESDFLEIQAEAVAAWPEIEI